MTDKAQIHNLYVAVFDGAGYKLSEYAKAELAEAMVNRDNGTTYRYSVSLTVSKEPRILHFIANAPKKLSYGSESEVIGSLYTSLSNDDVDSFQESYWQRIEMEKIPARPLAGEDATDYNAAAAKLNGIKLVRNYSKITFSTDLDPSVFDFEGAWLINAPDRGTVAPYNRNTGEFQSDYLTYDNVGALEDPAGGNYQRFMLATTEYDVPSNASYFVETGTGKNMIDPVVINSKKLIQGFVYEREKALENPMYIIIKAKYNGSPTSSYYKIALQNSTGEFYSMLRNFNYLVKVAKVSAKGRESAWDAYISAPSGDISLNVEFQDIKTISDGEARIAVIAMVLAVLAVAAGLVWGLGRIHELQSAVEMYEKAEAAREETLNALKSQVEHWATTEGDSIMTVIEHAANYSELSDGIMEYNTLYLAMRESILSQCDEFMAPVLESYIIGKANILNDRYQAALESVGKRMHKQ